MNRNKIFTSIGRMVIAVLILVSSSLVQAQPVSKQTDEAVKELIKDYDNSSTPGGAIMVIREGRVVYEKSFGMANLTHDIPFEISTPTNLGSTTKQFTAYGIALLEDRGLLSVNDDVRKHIPELPDLGDTVRLRHLLSHTSGYREYINTLLMAGRQVTDPIRKEEIIMVVQHQPRLQNKPGELYNYNNTGYALLAMVIERVTGEDYDEWMKENVFLPLGMTHTLVRTHPGQIIPGNAQGYLGMPEDNYVESMDVSSSAGAGGIYSTLPDLEKWVRNFYDPKQGDEFLIQKIQTPFILNNGDTMNYAYGLILGELKGLKMVEHGGADIAHRSMLMMFPEVKGAVITQSNNSGFSGQISRKIAEIFFADVMDINEDEKKKDESPDAFVYDVNNFGELAGRYELEISPGFYMEFRGEDDKLLTQATGQSAVEIFASSDSTFYLKVVEASVTFHRNADGKVDHMTLHQNGNHRANRIFEAPWEPTVQDLEMYQGSYFSDELEALFAISLNEEEELVLRHRRMDDKPLKAESTDEFSADFPIPEIKFIRNPQGEVTGFEASSGRSKGIVFEKQ